MRDRGRQRRRRRRHGDTLLLKQAVVWVVLGTLLTAAQLLSLGHVTPPVLAVDTITGALVPFGLMSLALVYERPGDERPPGDEDDEDGGGGPPRLDDPSAPTGGLEVDWERFEAEFYAYAQSYEALV